MIRNLSTLLQQYTSARDSPTVDNTPTIQSSFATMVNYIDHGKFSQYPPSKKKVLDAIGGDSRLGPGLQERLADFTAERSGLKFAVELKTTRTERTIVEGEPTGKAMKPDWWGEMFLNNARTKIEDKDRHSIKQLTNTCDKFECNVSMLVLYSRRLGVSVLAEPHEYREKLEVLKEEYPQIDFLASMDYYGTFAIVPDIP